MRPEILPIAKYAMLTSKNKFGDMSNNPAHILERLNNFVERLNDPDLMDGYRKLYANGNRHPDLFLEDKGFSTNKLHEYFTDRAELHETRKLTDFPTMVHLGSGGKLERYLVKLINRLDDEILIQSNIDTAG